MVTRREAVAAATELRYEAAMWETHGDHGLAVSRRELADRIMARHRTDDPAPTETPGR